MAAPKLQKVFVVLTSYDWEGYDPPLYIAATRKAAREAATAHRKKGLHKWRKSLRVDCWSAGSAHMEIIEQEIYEPATKPQRKSTKPRGKRSRTRSPQSSPAT